MLLIFSKPASHFHLLFSSLSFPPTPTSSIAHHWTFAFNAPPRNMLLLFQHGTWLCYFTMELASTFAPPWNRLSAKRRYVPQLVMWCLLFIWRSWNPNFFYQFFFPSLVLRSCHSLWLWFVVEVRGWGWGCGSCFVVHASCFFSSIRDSWFILKVVVRSVWQWFVQFVLMFSSCLKYSCLNVTSYFMIIIV